MDESHFKGENLKGDFMLSNFPDTYQFEPCDDTLTLNLGAMGLCGEAQRYDLLNWADETLPRYTSNRAYAPHEYMVTQQANFLQGGTCLEDSRAISEDDGLKKWLRLRDLPAPNTQGDGFGTATWKHVHQTRRKNRDEVSDILTRRGVKTLHVDIDAKVHQSDRDNAKNTYKGFPGDCPLYVMCPDEKLVFDALFRPGNFVPKQHLASTARTTLRTLPDSLETIRVTLDGAGWQVDVVDTFQQANGSSDPTVHYYIRPAKVSCDPSNRAKHAISAIDEVRWVVYGNDTDWEIAETTITVANAEKRCESRLVVVRKPVQEEDEEDPDQTTLVDEYRYYTVATNDEERTPREIFEQYNRRGAAEDLIGELVEDGEAERFPMHADEANGLWLRLNTMTFNLAQSMKDHALPPDWKTLTLASLRRRLFGMALRLINHARRLIVKFPRSHPWAKHIVPFIEGCWQHPPDPAPT